METVQQNGRFTLFSSEFHSNKYSILFGQEARVEAEQGVKKQHIQILLLLPCRAMKWF